MSHLDEWFKEKLKKDKKTKKKLQKKYEIKVKGFKVVIEELKKRISAKSKKLRHYQARGNQYTQMKIYVEKKSTQVPPNAEEVKEFWSKLWDNPAPYKEDVGMVEGG